MMIILFIYLFIGWISGLWAVYYALKKAEDMDAIYMLVIALVMIVYWLPAFIMERVITSKEEEK